MPKVSTYFCNFWRKGLTKKLQVAMMTLAYSSFDIISFHGNYKQLVYSLNLLHVIVHQVSAFDQKNVMNFLFKNLTRNTFKRHCLSSCAIFWVNNLHWVFNILLLFLKEPDYPYMEIGQHIDLFSQKVKTEDQFIEVKSVTGHKLDRENSLLE